MRIEEKGGRECGAGGSGGAGEYEGVVSEVFDGMCEPSLYIAGIKGGAPADRMCWAVGHSLGAVEVGEDGDSECGGVGVGECEGGGERERLCIGL